MSGTVPEVVGQQQQQQPSTWGVDWLWQGIPPFQQN
jgi:hypothetical protein